MTRCLNAADDRVNGHVPRDGGGNHHRLRLMATR
jgi:hypothetical protein